VLGVRWWGGFRGEWVVVRNASFGRLRVTVGSWKWAGFSGEFDEVEVETEFEIEIERFLLRRNGSLSLILRRAQGDF